MPSAMALPQKGTKTDVNLFLQMVQQEEQASNRGFVAQPLPLKLENSIIKYNFKSTLLTCILPSAHSRLKKAS